MNTTELKKLAEAVIKNPDDMKTWRKWEAHTTPPGIIVLLDINAELADAVRSMLSLVRHNAPELSGKVLGDAEAALAKAEGGEL